MRCALVSVHHRMGQSPFEVAQIEIRKDWVIWAPTHQNGGVTQQFQAFGNVVQRRPTDVILFKRNIGDESVNRLTGFTLSVRRAEPCCNVPGHFLTAKNSGSDYESLGIFGDERQ